MKKETTIKKDSPKKVIDGRKRRGRPKKTVASKPVVQKGSKEIITDKPKTIRRTYSFAVGRRKSAIARVRYHKKGSGQFIINNLAVDKYFHTLELQQIAMAPLTALGLKVDTDITIRVAGGGQKGQAEAVRHGIARVLILVDEGHRSQLKRLGFLKRDARVKERKKAGLKRARRAPQWKKR